MQAYTIIARKYRPQTFRAIVGQDHVVTTLKNSLRLQRTAHAYLFCGPKGTGKTTLARLFAKALNCTQYTEEPCNQCSSCLEITGGHSLDVMEIDGASNRGIDDIRQINETANYAAASGRFKIYIIDEVHMLTKEAFNALLKTLEEPPSNVKFFMATTEPQKVPGTIISRCQRFDLKRIQEKEIVGKLGEICRDLQKEIESQALHLIAHLAEGGLRDAQTLLDQVMSYAEGPITVDSVSRHLGLAPRELFFTLDEHFQAGDPSFSFALTSQVLDIGCDLGTFLEGLAEHYRLLLLLKYNPDHIEDPRLSYLDTTSKQRYIRSATFYTLEQCLHILDVLVDWLQKMAKTPYPRISCEMILLTILRSRHRISLETLVHRLTLLEAGLSEKGSDSIDKSLLAKDLDQVPHTPEPMAKSSYFGCEAIVATGSPEKEVPRTLDEGDSQQTDFQIPTQARYETILRFAAVELEGVVKK